MINSYNIKYKKKAPADFDKELTFIWVYSESLTTRDNRSRLINLSCVQVSTYNFKIIVLSGICSLLLHFDRAYIPTQLHIINTYA